MSKNLHILSFQQKLKAEKQFLQSLLCKKIARRKLILEKASNKQVHLLQKLLVLFVRGDIEVQTHFINRLKRSKKLRFVEEKFNKVKKDPDLKKNLISLVSVLPLFVKIIFKKK